MGLGESQRPHNFCRSHAGGAAGNLAGLISTGGDGLNVRRNNATKFLSPPGQYGHERFRRQWLADRDALGNNVASGSYTAGVPHLVIAVAGGQKNYSTFWIGTPTARWGVGGEGLLRNTHLRWRAHPANLNSVGYYFQAKYICRRPSLRPLRSCAVQRHRAKRCCL